MTIYRRALAMGCLLAALPLASTSWAQSANRPVSSDGSVPPMVEAASNISMNYAGTGRGGLAARESAPSEMAALLRLRPLSGPGSNPESIIGADNRVLVSNTRAYPYRAIVLITFSAGRCTGWLINRNTVVTAGHCVSRGNNTGFYNRTTFRIYAGRNGASSPYGVCTAARLYSNTFWTQQGRDDYDYGAIKLNCNVGNTVGWFGYFWSTRDIVDYTVTISGYPGDKPLTQWRHTDYIRLTHTTRVFYAADTVGGQSGSPVYTSWRLCNPCSAAVHAYGTGGSYPYSTFNHGTRITSEVFNNLTAWKNAP